MLPTLLDFPKAQKSTFLIVCLAKLSNGSKLDLESRVVASLSTWPSASRRKPHFVYARVNRNARVGEIIDIFRLAQLAKNANWSDFAVFDTLSLQQLEGRVRRGESLDLSFVTVGVRNDDLQGEESPGEDEDGIAALRMSLDDTVGLLQSTDADVHQMLYDYDWNEPWRTEAEWPTLGLAIRDPQRPPFSCDAKLDAFEKYQEQLVTTILAKKPFLPPEIRLQIRQYLDEDDPIEKLTFAPPKTKRERDRLQIHILGFQTQEELSKLEDDLNSRVKQISPRASCTIYPWRKLLPASRKEVFQLARRLRVKQWMVSSPILLLFLYPEQWYREEKLGLITLRRQTTDALILREVSLGLALNLWDIMVQFWVQDATRPSSRISRSAEHLFEPYSEFEDYIEEDCGFEILCNPRSRFFHDIPAWLPHPNDDRADAPPLFFLTKDYSDEELNILTEFLHIPNQGQVGSLHEHDLEDSKTDFYHIPWEKQREGSLEDVWDIFKEYHNYETGWKSYTWKVFFADRESFVDGKVILTSPLREQSGDDRDWILVGMEYARVPVANAARAWQYVDGHNVSVDYLSTVDKFDLDRSEVSTYRPQDGVVP